MKTPRYGGVIVHVAPVRSSVDPITVESVELAARPQPGDIIYLPEQDRYCTVGDGMGERPIHLPAGPGADMLVYGVGVLAANERELKARLKRDFA